MLAAYVPSAVLDAEIAAQGLEFGRDGKHKSGNAKVLVRSADNPRSVYRWCRAPGEKVWHSREYEERRRAKFAAKRVEEES
jgi:peroxiredoxin